jgi:urease alpha subunit
MTKEHEIGSIEKGKAADMIVLDRNLFEIAPDTIIDTKVVYTIFGGKIVYDAEGAKSREGAAPRSLRITRHNKGIQADAG